TWAPTRTPVVRMSSQLMDRSVAPAALPGGEEQDPGRAVAHLAARPRVLVEHAVAEEGPPRLEAELAEEVGGVVGVHATDAGDDHLVAALGDLDPDGAALLDAAADGWVGLDHEAGPHPVGEHVLAVDLEPGAVQAASGLRETEAVDVGHVHPRPAGRHGELDLLVADRGAGGRAGGDDAAGRDGQAGPLADGVAEVELVEACLGGPGVGVGQVG